MDAGSAHYTCPLSCSARGPALRFLDKKRVSVQQGSPFGHGWECDGKSKIWRKKRRMTRCEERKLSFCQRLERMIKEKKIILSEKKDGCKPAPFLQKKNLNKINE